MQQWTPREAAGGGSSAAHLSHYNCNAGPAEHDPATRGKPQRHSGRISPRTGSCLAMADPQHDEPARRETNRESEFSVRRSTHKSNQHGRRITMDHLQQVRCGRCHREDFALFRKYFRNPTFGRITRLFENFRKVLFQILSKAVFDPSALQQKQLDVAPPVKRTSWPPICDTEARI
jgi:hypothetical protein